MLQFVIPHPLEQLFLSFFAPETPKSQENFHRPLNYQSVRHVDPRMLITGVKQGKIVYF